MLNSSMCFMFCTQSGWTTLLRTHCLCAYHLVNESVFPPGKSSDMRFAHWAEFLDPASRTSTGDLRGGNCTIGAGPLDLYEEAWEKSPRHGQHSERPKSVAISAHVAPPIDVGPSMVRGSSKVLFRGCHCAQRLLCVVPDVAFR